MRTIFSFMLCIGWLTVHAQKHDYVWFIASPPDNKATKLDFNQDSLELTVVNMTMPLFSDASAFLCDENSNMLAYTNGIWIANKTGEMMDNGDSINVGIYANIGIQSGYPAFNGCFFLPKPGNPSQYYLFHMLKELFGVVPSNSDPQSLHYSLINFSTDISLGKVIEKDIPLLVGDTLIADYRHATAVKHANGRDWWLVLPNHLKPQYFRLLVTPKGIFGPWVQEIGFKELPEHYTPASKGLFSPNGYKFADYGLTEFIEVFDFDRCTGLLSNSIKLDIDWMPGINNGNGDLAFSPSGRFLYVTRMADDNGTTELAQYDLEASDVPASKIVIASCTSVTPYTCFYGNALLCPDGKIYVPSAGKNAFHVIHKPDMPGAACEFEYGGLVFPLDYPYTFLPYFPNYRLYDLPGSACDTLGINAPVATNEFEKKAFKLYPNPATNILHISSPLSFSSSPQIFLYNISGQLARRWNLPDATGETTLSLDGLPGGMYIWRVCSQGQPIANGKLIILE